MSTATRPTYADITNLRWCAVEALAALGREGVDSDAGNPSDWIASVTRLTRALGSLGSQSDHGCWQVDVQDHAALESAVRELLRWGAPDESDDDDVAAYLTEVGERAKRALDTLDEFTSGAD